MLNQSGITKESYGAQSSILIAPELAFSLSCKIANTGITADSEGKKIVKAGTPLYGSLTARDTAFTISGGANENPVAVALHDVDVTAGTKNGTALIGGYVDLSFVDATTATALAAATPAHIVLVK